MKDLQKQFDKIIAYLTKARDAYLSKKINISWEIMDKFKRKFYKLVFGIEMEKIRRKYDDWKNELTAIDIQALQIFNDQLAALEKKIAKEAHALEEAAQRLLATKEEQFVTCFHLDIEIDYSIGEDDPDYNEDRYNCIAKSRYVTADMIGHDDNNCNDMRSTDLPLAHQKHCWLFHDLYDHVHLSWKNILRIRKVYTHIIAYYGNDVSIQKELLYAKQ